MSTSTPTTRVVHISTVPESLGFLRGQLGYLQTRGLDFVAISSPGDLLDRFAEEQQIPVRAVRMLRQISPFQDIRAVIELSVELRRLQPAIVHTHTPKAGLLGTIAAILAGVPVRIYQMRGLPLLTASGWRRGLLRWAERVTCLGANEVICVSHSLRDAAIAEGLCRPEKLNVLASGSGNGVDASGKFDPRAIPRTTRDAVRAAYEIPENALVIGFVGRLVRDKGVLELLEAWRILAGEFPELHLMIVGMLEERDAIPEDAVATLRTGPRIHWRGPDWNVAPLYAAMDVVALPTYREGFPNVPLEAAALELPVVATRVPGCVDAIEHGVSGLLITPRDAGALAQALRRYITDPELRRAHGQAGRRRVTREFRQEVICAAMHDVYQRRLQAAGIAIGHSTRDSAK